MENSKKAFWRGFFEGLEEPLSLSIPDIKRFAYRRKAKVVKSRLGNQGTDWAKLNGDMRRAMVNVIGTR